MVYGARTSVPFAFGLLASALLSLLFSHHDTGNLQKCTFRDGQQLASNADDYVYNAGEWRVELRKPPLSSSSVNAPSSKVIRSRYAATELGTRERLVVIIFGQSALSGTLSTLLAAHVPHVQIFMEASRMDSETGTFPNLTPYRQNGQHSHVHVLNSIFNLTFHENYDWFLFVSERSYVNPFALRRLIDELSWGTARAVGRRASDGKCRFDAGVLLSNPAVQLLIQQRHLCGAITASSDQAAFEMCVQHATNLTCSENGKTTPFRWWNFEEGSEPGTAIHERVPALRNSRAFNSSMTVSPLLSELDARVLHAHFVSVEMARVSAQIAALSTDLADNERTFAQRLAANRSAVVPAETTAANTGEIMSWPIGMPHALKPSNRYQVPIWDYFTGKHLFRHWPNRNVETLEAEDALDIAEVVARARRKVESQNGDSQDLEFLRLRDGYRRFNALRGMEYAVDLEYRRDGDKTTPIVLRRVHLCRPIFASELIESVPYVKEDTDITLVIPVEGIVDVDAASRLLSRQTRQCGSGSVISDKRQTRFVVAVRGLDASATRQLNDELEGLKRGCKTWRLETVLLALKTPQSQAGGQQLSLRVAAMDEAVDHYGQQTIYALISPHADYQREFLDRIRISTIRHYQAFSPIPFAEFHPLVAKADEIFQRQPRFYDDDSEAPTRIAHAVRVLQRAALNLSVDEWPLVVHKDRGFFDLNDFSVFSVYGTDYTLMRERYSQQSEKAEKKSASGDSENNGNDEPRSNQNHVVDVEDLFLFAQDQIHVLRAIDPSLRVRYHARDCTQYNARCLLSARTALGTKAQMANLTFRNGAEKQEISPPKGVPLMWLQPVAQAAAGL